MFKFFRRIRQNLLVENRFSKYLLYAFGEIILVVIGILIALQINNWNEDRKNDRQERYLLTQLLKEFQRDSTTMANQIRLTHWKARDGKLVQQHLLGKAPMRTDSLVTFLFFNGKALFFRSHTPTYDEILGSGKLGIIKNDSIKLLISRFKSNVDLAQTFLFSESQKIKDSYNVHIRKYFEGTLMTRLWKTNFGDDRFIPQEELDNYMNDVEGFTTDPASIFHVNSVMGVDAELNWHYSERMSQRINEILEAIRNELNRVR